MKKLIILLGFLIGFAFAADAQTYTLYGQEGQQFFKSTQDLTITNVDTVDIYLKSVTDWPTTQHAILDIDSVSGNHTAMTLTLWGRNFDSAAWTSITATIVDQGVIAATDLTLTNTTETRWRQFKMRIISTGAAGVSTLNSMEFLILNPD
jgi:hypothetical protein